MPRNDIIIFTFTTTRIFSTEETISNLIEGKVLQLLIQIRLKLIPYGTRREEMWLLGMRGMQIWKNDGLGVLMRRAARRVLLWQTQQMPKRAWSRTIETVTAELSQNLPGVNQKRYEEWLGENVVTDRVRGLIRADIGYFSIKPKVSVVMPVYNTRIRFLREAIDSVRNQLYDNWELCVADDGSEGDVADELKRLAELDRRIKVIRSEVNLGISEATNRGIGLATGEFIGLLDHDDLLSETALYYIVKALNEDPTLGVIYTDRDHVTENGTRTDPFFKPDWSPHTILSCNYMIHFLVFRKSLLSEVGLLRKEYDGSQDYDLILRLTEKTDKIQHIPKILYSWRKHSGSNSLIPRSAAFEAGRLAIQNAIRRRGHQATVEKAGEAGPYRVSYEIRGRPLVSIIISSRNIDLLSKCIESLKTKGTYSNYEVLVATNALGDREIQSYCAQNDIRLVEIEDGFFSKMNNAAVSLSQGEYVVFLNDDIEIVTPQWIEEMLALCQQPKVAAVGAKLVHPNGRIQFVRIVAGIRRDGIPYFYDPFDTYGESYFFGFRADIISDVMGVSGACMMVRRAEFLASGGFDVEILNLNMQDVDLCLRLHAMGYSVLYTPYATVVHHVSSSKKMIPHLFAKEVQHANAFFNKNKALLVRGDPFYNPNLVDVHAFVEPTRFPDIDRVDVADVCYPHEYWKAYLFPIWPKGHFISNRSKFIDDTLPFAARLMEVLDCEKVVDVGCGPGILTEAFQKLGIEVWGLEGSAEALKYAPVTVRQNIIQGDVSSSKDVIELESKGPFNVAICMEVLEHIPQDLVDEAIKNIGRLSDTIIVTTPEPNLWDRDDKTHLCVMQRGFWVERFQQAGYVEDRAKSTSLFGRGYQSSPDTNLFIFVRSKII